ncbi:MAG: hypothetical protein ACTHV8_04160 [Nesterenkonia sp.]
MTTFLTADLHFCHDTIRELAPRPFDSVDEMDKVLIANWNETVGIDDEVWVLRDLGKPLIHGHVHDAWRTRFSKESTPMVNVGVERWDYRPVPAEDVHRVFRQMSA